MMIFGAHVSTAGGVSNAPGNAKPFGIHAIQIFTKNQRQWNAKPLHEEEVKRWFDQLREHDIQYTCSHASYLINLCAPDDEKRTKSLDSMTDELQRAETLGLSHVILHPGSHLKEGEEWGLDTIAASIDELHKRLPGYATGIALENTAGQGTNLGYSFEQLARIIETVNEPERLAVCFDTCHGYSAGYDLKTETGYVSTWAEFDRILGLDRLALIHLNDTKKELGSRVDRHEMIGDGLLGDAAFGFLLKDERLKHIPAILETPEGEDGYAKDLKRLRTLLQAKD
ncbi:deoxyribonuclease IV [bacterium]|nr:deoxyribonuclease IV [bacterium]